MKHLVFQIPITENKSVPQQFVLLGLVSQPDIQMLLFVVFLVIYITTVIGNVMIITVIQLDANLHKPMYFFLKNLSFLEIFYTTTTIPSSVINVLFNDGTISIVGCFTQMFFFVALGGSECILLTVMAYDRYNAICQPLRYSKLMNPSLCLHLAVISWSTGVLNSLIQTSSVVLLPICKSNEIGNFFCDLPALLKSCGGNTLGNFLALLIGEGIITGSLTLTILSYIYIIRAVLRASRKHTIYKTFSTCSSHLTVVIFFFGTILIPFILPSSPSSFETDRAPSIIYGVLTPFLNPFIYSIRNKDFKEAVVKMMEPLGFKKKQQLMG